MTMNLKPVRPTWILAVGFLLAATAAQAACVSPGFNPTASGFCNGCRYEGTMSMARDEACRRDYHPNPHMTRVEFLGHRLVQRARHGIAGLSGLTFAYQPNRGFVGSDDFAIAVNYRQGSETGKFTVH
jgi:hypothetical protein